ncbi:FecR family protein [Steroidobacter sp.]|uniref:FecR family protein n=1 Tax=Steroidobacter sp. TaxID=1978227 RepID=UPI001A52ABE3|nr:FecR domain-containing protein [Steroidobacter sp.]MBL8267966.1 FecR domain-containing protein [Steroidobacter sp.]
MSHAQARIPKDIYRVASDWLVRRSEGALPETEEREYQQWLTASPLHAAAFEKLAGVWGEVGEMKDLAAVTPLAPARTAKPPVWQRPMALAAALAIATVGAVFGIVKLSAPERIETQLAEVREVTLPDGSKVTLGAKTQIDVDFSKDRRNVTLANGEAFFDVAHDTSRPFFVAAGNTQIRVVGTRFDVRRGLSDTSVSVVQGIVAVSEQVESVDEPLARGTLTAGQRIEVAARTPTAKRSPETNRSGAIATVPTERVGAWRYGRLEYEDRRLAEMLADVQRYYKPGMELATPELGDLLVTAAFRVDEISQIAVALEQALPIKAVQSADGHIVLYPRR